MSANKPRTDSCQRGNTIQQLYSNATGASYGADPGGFGNPVLTLGSGFPDCRMLFPLSEPGWITCFRWAVRGLPSGASPIIGIFDGIANTEQGVLSFNSDGTLQFYKNGVAIGPKSSQIFLPQTVIQLQVKYIVNATTGLAEVRLNGQPGAIISFTGNTQQSANASANAINFKSCAASASSQAWSDIFVFDTTNPSAGTQYDSLVDYPGNGKVALLMPNNDSATGGLNQMTPNPTQAAGSHYLDINHTASLGDAQYLAGATAPLRESWRLPALPANAAQMAGLNEFILARIDDAGPHTDKLGIRNATVDSFTADFNPGSSYAYQEGFFTINPSTSGALTPADIPNTEIQVQLDS